MRGPRLRETHHRRYFVPPERVRDGWVEFTPGQAHQMTHVLRLRSGDRVSIFDGTGREAMASLTVAMPRRVKARLLEELPLLPSPHVRVALAQVVPRGPAMDLIVAKATELGVGRIIPLEGERSVRRACGDRSGRWLRIVQEAAEQCGRRDLPEIAHTSTLEAFLLSHPRETPLLACDVSRESQPLMAACRELRDAHSLVLLVGGEGGLSPTELMRLRSHGARLTSLGPWLLRAETAAMAALAIAQAAVRDWEIRPDGEIGGRSSLR
jgi:16S rRNA (uracil1498-N3)-methyltransferase